nr:MAG TPA: triphosphate pyrophosphohydrolase [Caudoviricetes sp.]
MVDVEFIASRLSREDILCQLAEEVAELAQAALKLRRVITGTNPTPVSEKNATDDLFEELADVAVAEEAYFASISDNYRQREGLEDIVGCIAKGKGERWVQRLKEKEDGHNEN